MIIFNYNISKVVVEIGNINATANSLTFSVGSEQKGSDIHTSSTKIVANETYIFERPEEEDWSSNYFDFNFNVTVSGSSNKYIQLKKISFYYESSLEVTDLTIKSLPTKTEYAFGEKLDLTGLEVTANWSDGTPENVTANCEITPAAGTLLTKDTTVTVTYQGKSATFDVTVGESTVNAADKYITAAALNLDTTYSNESISYNGVVFGRTDVMKGISDNANTIQFKASTGKFWNITNLGGNIKTVIIAFDADNEFAPLNYAVYAGTTAGSTTTEITSNTIDATNHVYSFDFSEGEYEYFTFAKTGKNATYIDMLVIELDTDLANSVRAAAETINETLAEECAALNVKESTWATLEASIADEEVISALNETILNTAPSKSGDSVQLTEAQKALSKYDYIVAKYGYNNFLSRDVAQTGRISLINDNNSLMVIAFIITAVAVGAVAMLVIRKRKYSK